MYKIIGADGREYGPVPAETVQQWVRDRRANHASRIRAEGTEDWTTLGALPEFAAVLQEAAEAAATPPSPAMPGAAIPDHAGVDGDPGASPIPDDIAERDYRLDLGDCVSRGWALVTGPRAGLVIGGCAVWLLVQFAINVLANIPIIGLLFSLASLVIGGALYGGLYSFMLRCLRGQPAEIGNLFDGFRYCFLQLFLSQLVTGLLVIAAAIPGGAMVGVGIYLLEHQTSQAAAVALCTVGGITLLVPIVYLTICWALTIPLIMDKRLDFWTAMKLSRRIVSHHWWLVFACMFVIGLLTGIGALLCLVGLFFTLPLGFGATCAVYETLTAVRTREGGSQPTV